MCLCCQYSCWWSLESEQHSGIGSTDRHPSLLPATLSLPIPAHAHCLCPYAPPSPLTHTRLTSRLRVLRRGLQVLCSSDHIEMWGDGMQTRSFTYIDDCVEGILRIMRSDFR